MKANFFIFHGTGGHPGENWFPWLKNKLDKSGYQTTIPSFPTPEGQSYEAWLTILNDKEQKINEDTILIGHSLGGLFLLRVLERLEKPVKAAFLVSAPIGIRPINNWDGDFAFSNGFLFDWSKIRENAGHFTVYHSDDDPYVGLGNGEELARQLGVQLTLIPNSGHFNASSGYTQFKKLLKDIKLLLTRSRLYKK